MNLNITLLGGGVGASTFTKALHDAPYKLTTLVSAFDDGGSTGGLRRDYGGFAIGDFRQCIIASLDMDQTTLNVLNYRFGKGALYGVNLGNAMLKAFLAQFTNQRSGVAALHKYLGLKNRVAPISYSFAQLRARLGNGTVLMDQDQIANYLSFHKAQIEQLFFSKSVVLNSDAKSAILKSDYLAFAPGNFFSSVVPHIYVPGFAAAWKKSKAKKVWFFNLLAHRGQDDFYTLTDYLRWFQNKLGKRPFDIIVLNKPINKTILAKVRDRFAPTRVTPADKKLLRQLGIALIEDNLLSSTVRNQQANDTVFRAPLRHDPVKIKRFFETNLK
jgi:uncharacterized cofD-like protein